MNIQHPTNRPNFSCVSIYGLTLWFSYETCIAFSVDGDAYCTENVWGPTTGKHINYVKGQYREIGVLGNTEFNLRVSRLSNFLSIGVDQAIENGSI